MTRILPRYLRKRFFSIFFSALFSVLVLFVVVDLVENLDRFIDRSVPWNITLKFYLYYIPYFAVLIIPVATQMGAVFSIAGLARTNEITAMKALGYSMHQVMRTLLILGLFLSVATFVMAEELVVRTNREKTAIENKYLKKNRKTVPSRIKNLVIQEPPDKIVTMTEFNTINNIALEVKIETFQEGRLVKKIDTPKLMWRDSVWVAMEGFERVFHNDQERATPLDSLKQFYFRFNPHELVLAQYKPDAMSFKELRWFVNRVRESGGEVRQWLTELHIRVAFPLSNLIIILLTVPLAYNRRQKSVAVGFGITLLVSFIYFGLVKMGQTMGEKGSAPPVVAAWMGNAIMMVAGVIEIIKTRK